MRVMSLTIVAAMFALALLASPAVDAAAASPAGPSTDSYPCPTEICDSGFQAAGGYVDCCKFSYGAAPNDKCAWAGTPVSWKKDRNCYTADAMYSVLIKGNFQGPPSTASCRCKDPAQTIGTPAPVPAPVVYYDALPNTDIPGNDIGSNGQAYTKVCGDVAAVQSACSKNSGCAGFTYGASEKCGYLKSKSPPFRSGWTAYRRKP